MLGKVNREKNGLNFKDNRQLSEEENVYEDALFSTADEKFHTLWHLHEEGRTIGSVSIQAFCQEVSNNYFRLPCS